MGGFDFTNQPSPRVVCVPASAGQLGLASTRTFVAGDSAVTSDPASHWAGGAGGGTPGTHYDLLEFPIFIGDGETITELYVDLTDTSGGNTMSAVVRFNNTSQFNNRLYAPTVVSAGDGTLQHMDMITAIGQTIVSTGPQLYSVVVWTNTATTTTHRVFGIRYTVTQG